MLFTFQDVPILYNKQLPVNGSITVKVSKETVFVFVDEKNVFSFYLNGLGTAEIKELLKECFRDYDVTVNDSELEDIYKKISSYF